MKAENLKGNKIQAVIEYINGTRSKIGRTAQEKKDLGPVHTSCFCRAEPN